MRLPTDHRRSAIAGAIILVVFLVVAFNLQTLFLIGWRATHTDQRPVLLSDATWNDTKSAQAFKRAFPTGSPAAALTDWLKANGFTLNAQGLSAERVIGGFPCSESIEINWSVSDTGVLKEAKATVTEAGCL